MISWFRQRHLIPERGAGLMLLFSTVFLFQLSMVKYTLNLGAVAIIANSLMLLFLSIIAIINIVGRGFAFLVWCAYLIPGILVYLGYFVNIIRSMVTDTSAVSCLGLLIPWAAYLSVPFLIRNLRDSEVIWRFFYRFMLAVCSIGLLEYLLVFNGALPVRIVDSPLGTFLSGGLTVFHSLDDQNPYYRLYAIFPEPGTYAMYILPVALYALVYKKHIGLTLFAVSGLLTDSLGGLIGSIFLSMLYVLNRLKKSNFSIGIIFLIVFIFTASVVSFFSGDFIEAYSSKNNSAEVRENNVINMVVKLPELVINNPLGFELNGESMSNINSDDYFGSNFAIGTAFVTGGLMSLFGYCILLVSCIAISILSLLRKVSDIDHLVVLPSLLVMLIFVVQRATVIDSAIFAFLFSPSIIRNLMLIGGQKIKKVAREIND